MWPYIESLYLKAHICIVICSIMCSNTTISSTFTFFASLLSILIRIPNQFMIIYHQKNITSYFNIFYHKTFISKFLKYLNSFTALCLWWYSVLPFCINELSPANEFSFLSKFKASANVVTQSTSTHDHTCVILNIFSNYNFEWIILSDTTVVKFLLSFPFNL